MVIVLKAVEVLLVVLYVVVVAFEVEVAPCRIFEVLLKVVKLVFVLYIVVLEVFVANEVAVVLDVILFVPLAVFCGSSEWVNRNIRSIKECKICSSSILRSNRSKTCVS